MLSLFPTIQRLTLPLLSTDQMREVDRLMIEDYGIVLMQMMENAGRNLADLAQAMLEDDVMDRPVLILAGRGNNGGGGLTAARHLSNRGAEVQVITAHPFDRFSGVPEHQLQALLAMGVSITESGDGWELPSADLVIDALIGYGLAGNPRGAVADLVRLANSHPAPILSLDAPSGLDTSNGTVFVPCIKAAATMTLALPKAGLMVAPEAVVGDLYLADISVPPALYESLDIDLEPLFSTSRILSVD